MINLHEVAVRQAYVARGNQDFVFVPDCAPDKKGYMRGTYYDLTTGQPSNIEKLESEGISRHSLTFDIGDLLVLEKRDLAHLSKKSPLVVHLKRNWTFLS